MVKHPDEMDDDTFRAHLAKRHMPFAGLNDLCNFPRVQLLRTYHHHRHFRGHVSDHEHRGIERAQ